ncbi:MAG: bifunctional tetrahydrofolate synthase/dihydrofolate synthase [Gammaproteobacteria bacterium]|nr:bifunctional tetrahydrofolate synthase/dihydrofolate synthase [Gammaproteobacteria bacterium]
MTLEKWLSRIESLHSHTIVMGLERVRAIAASLNLSHFSCPVILIGGTNGKGSSVKFVASILQANGYQVGTYTSPHLLHFNERICINDQPVTDEILSDAFEVIDRARQTVVLTFFEFTTLAALWIFKQAKLDALILEVGMGGRLDAVNIVEADIAVVTSVDMDHMEWLGETREEIGYEKAGIFKPTKVAICGDLFPPESVKQRARDLACPFYCIGKDFSFERDNNSWSWHSTDLIFEHLPIPRLSLTNAAIALMVISKLQERLPVSFAAVREGLQQAALPGRFQKIGKIILDVAHNPAAAAMLANNLNQLNHNGRLIGVVGMLADKDISATLQPLFPLIQEWHLGTLSVKRGAEATLLARSFKDIPNVNCYTYDAISSAFNAASNNATTNDKIIVFGSFYTVAEVLSVLSSQVNLCSE